MSNAVDDFESEKEQIAFLKGLAQGIWRMDIAIGDNCGYCKSYDPLEIEVLKDRFEVHSYVFDFHDGGRHHNFKTLKEIEDGLYKEIDLIKGLEEGD